MVHATLVLPSLPIHGLVRTAVTGVLDELVELGVDAGPQAIPPSIRACRHRLGLYPLSYM